MDIKDLPVVVNQLKDMLAPLAQKIGQTGQHIFELYVRQVYVVGIVELVIASRLFRYCRSEQVKDYSERDDNYGLGYLVAIILFVTGMAAILVPIAGVIEAFVNPEYQAIQLIVQTVRDNTPAK